FQGVIADHVQNGRKSFLFYDGIAVFHLADAGRNVCTRIIYTTGEDFTSAEDLSALFSDFFERLTHLFNGFCVNERPHENAVFQRVSDLNLAVGGNEQFLKPVEDRVLHDQPPDGCAPLPGCPNGAEQDGPQGEVEVSARSNYNGVVASKLQQRLSQSSQNKLADTPPHRHAAGGGDQRQPPVRNQPLANLLSRTDHDIQKPFRKAAIPYHATGYRVCSNGTERDFAGRLPDNGVACDQRDHGVPGPYGNR